MIRRHLLSLWDVYARPTKGFATFAEQPPFGAALLLILILGTVTALTGLHPGTDSTVRYAQALTGDAPLYRQAGVYALTFLQMLLGAALIAWLCARLLRDRIRFEVVFAALAFAALPWLCVALAYPLAVQNRLAYDAVQLFAACILLWIGVLAGIGLHIACKLERWKAALITLPLALAFLALGFNTFRSAPATFAITYPFQRWEGSHIVLYYPQGKSREEIAGFGRQTETTLNQVCKTLAVAPPSFKICVYLFPDVRLHREATGGGQDPAETDYAFANCLTMPYRPWKDCGNAMAHELTHIIVENRIASSVHGMIDEGLANYVASGIAPDYREPAAIPSTDLPLKVLARGDVFYDWAQAQEEGGSALTYYAHAQGLVGYLIEQYGLDKFKQFYQNLSERAGSNDSEGEDLSNAAEEIYDVTLTQLEADWRKAEKPPQEPGTWHKLERH